MGVNQTKDVNIVLVGLSPCGKTHFLDYVVFGESCTHVSTNGYYETVCNYGNYILKFVELGGSPHLRKFWTVSPLYNEIFDKRMDALYVFVDPEYQKTHQEWLILNSYVQTILVGRKCPVAIVVNLRDKYQQIPKGLRRCFQVQHLRKLGYAVKIIPLNCSINHNNISTLLDWTTSCIVADESRGK
jgi:ADP-ribosylation factor family